MSSVDKAQEKMGNIIYETLKANGIKENRAFITDISSEALYRAGYRKPPEGEQDLLLSEKDLLKEHPWISDGEHGDTCIRCMTKTCKAQLAHAEYYYNSQGIYCGTAIIEEAKKQEREGIIDLLQDLLETSAKVKEPVIKVKLTNILQALKESPHLG